jgi:hypothetical protein
LRGLFELAVNSQLNAADGQQIDSRFRLAGFDDVADPELPFPDVRRRAQRHAVLYALIHHERASPRLTDGRCYDGPQVVDVQYRSFPEAMTDFLFRSIRHRADGDGTASSCAARVSEALRSALPGKAALLKPQRCGSGENGREINLLAQSPRPARCIRPPVSAVLPEFRGSRSGWRATGICRPGRANRWPVRRLRTLATPICWYHRTPIN